MKEYEEVCAERDRLRCALAALVGASEIVELEQLEFGLRLIPAPQADKAVMIDAIHTLIATAPKAGSRS